MDPVTCLYNLERIPIKVLRAAIRTHLRWEDLMVVWTRTTEGSHRAVVGTSPLASPYHRPMERLDERSYAQAALAWPTRTAQSPVTFLDAWQETRLVLHWRCQFGIAWSPLAPAATLLLSASSGPRAATTLRAHGWWSLPVPWQVGNWFPLSCPLPPGMPMEIPERCEWLIGLSEESEELKCSR
jgi:hypothetical protein